MSNFIYDIQLGFLAFPLVAILLAIPYALYQYRRFGAISVWKTFVVFTFILYCLCAVSLIVFPLPADHNTIVEIAQTPQLHPFHFIEQIQETTNFSWTDRSTWGPTLKARATYEAYFNVLLTIPLGAYLCYLFRCRWWTALLIGIATTLLFETSQLTGLFGLYAHPYRLFDVDDLILNTTGTMLGFWLMIPLAWALPSMDEVNEQAREKGTSRVTLTRRVLAAVVDLTVLVILFALTWIFLSPTNAQTIKALAIDPTRSGVETLAFRFIGGLAADPMSALLIAFGIGAVLFAVLPMISKGRTIGKALVGIRIVKADGSDAPVWSYWLRFLASAFFLIVPVFLIALAPDEVEGVSSSMLFQIIGLVVLVWILTVIVRMVRSFTGHPYVSLSELVSGTRLAPSKQDDNSIDDLRDVQDERDTRDGNQVLRSSEQEGARRSLGQQNDARSKDQYSSVQADYQNIVADTSQTKAFDRRQQVDQQVGWQTTQRTPDQARNNAAKKDDYGKQAALDSLLAVNYDEQHPTAGTIEQDRSHSRTAAAGIPAASGFTQAPTQILSAGGEGGASGVASAQQGTQQTHNAGQVHNTSNPPNTEQIHGVNSARSTDRTWQNLDHAPETETTRQVSDRVPDTVLIQQLDDFSSQADQTRQIDSSVQQADRTQRISDPDIERRIRRDQRPDSGGTRAFKRQK